MRESSPLNLSRALMIVGRLVLGGILIYAAYTKFFIPGMRPHPPVRIALALFATQIDSYQMLPPQAVTLLAHTLPYVELGLGLLLVIGWELRIFAAIATALLVGFFAVVVRSYAKGLQINCGCFGPGEILGVKEVVRDGLFVAMAVTLTIAAFRAHRRPHPWSAPLETPKTERGQ
jgi:uncharacterized membrane protein YphA (DoxX/SURF4 family)